ncbi:outer membrane protein OmpK [Shewanella gelidii]|uniref:Membrane protein n=1 Tax=Shewanella gelidii TaxID=1642821 RepID=A0A917N924_9GAMM|nr:outer membrane protein OmpK [Shewanella gelidii]MCL1097155.1 outer membrane protein OmpK [Shewanella gelidii]GGI72928.1 membrane protein [Shewanella gelidii]
MKNLKTFALAGTVALAGTAFTASAADRGDDVHAGNYKWMQANLMLSVGEKPQANDDADTHDYLELEFGGRAGILDYYGYVDVFNLSNRDGSSQDKKDGSSKMFMKLAPRFSLDAITGKDLSYGAIKEVYFSTLFNWGGGAIPNDVNNSFWGIGADVELPWLGKTGMNVYGLYDLNAKKWDGYQFSMNWFKPFYFLENGSFISYQGYIDYQWGVDEVSFFPGEAGQLKTDKGGTMFNGIYWHSDRYSLGYGLKAYKDVYALADGGIVGETTGFSHFFAATYKF